MDAAATLRRARLAAGMSQRDLADAASVAQPAIARIESGRVIPRVDTLDRLLGACGHRLATAAVPRADLDPTTIRELLKLSPRERLDLAVREARNLDALLAKAGRG